MRANWCTDLGGSNEGGGGIDQLNLCSDDGIDCWPRTIKRSPLAKRGPAGYSLIGEICVNDKTGDVVLSANRK